MGGDFTVRGGSAGGGAHGGLGTEAVGVGAGARVAHPVHRLLDSAGGKKLCSFEALGRTYLPDGNTWTDVDVKLLNTVPVVSAVLGSVAGLPALHAVLAHFNVMTKQNAQVFPGGPPVVRAATGTEITKEELGGPDIHVRQSGVVDNLAEDEDDALDQVRRFLSYLPTSVDEPAPRSAATDPADRRDDVLATAVDRNPRRPFDARRIIRAVVDEGSFFEIAPNYGGARVTGLARIDGYAVGVMANDPRRLGGATDVAAGSKAARLIQLWTRSTCPSSTSPTSPG